TGSPRASTSSARGGPDVTFLGDPSHCGLFSRIVRGEEQQWRVWEDEAHVAFLTPFPSAPGFTVLVPRRPLTSDIFRLEEDDYRALVLAARKVALLLEEGLGGRVSPLLGHMPHDHHICGDSHYHVQHLNKKIEHKTVRL
uniref:HIT domain-containing protein n=1 Tax=Paramormyrops kingsleyae TaxID=1676925 RepID=A0A3B3RL43_9TELE